MKTPIITKPTLKTALMLIAFLFTAGLHAQQVSWDVNAKKTGPESAEITFTASIPDGWYIYAMNIPEGPIPTSFNFEEPKGYQPIGNAKPITPPAMKHDEGFGVDLGVHKKTASFRQGIKLTQSGKVNVKGYLTFQSCENDMCHPPVDVDFDLQVDGKTAEAQPDNKTDNADPADNKAYSDDTKKDSLAVSADEADSAEVGTAKKDGPATDEKTGTRAEETTATDDNNKQAGNSSLWGLFFIAFLAGLAGILTPCVYPMIPMTVSFFMNSSGGKRSQAITKALIFGISVTLIYTLVGLIVTLSGTGSDLPGLLSTHWLPNLLFFLLFITFAFSFLGMFEITLPSGIANKADQQVDKGGYVAAFFMALTLVIVSFSCTGPIVGFLLVEASTGGTLMPTVGMFAFGLAFALPFTLLALFPSALKKMPKSGGWMNAVKVVFGILLLTFGLKYLSVVDQSFQLGLFTRELFIAIWIAAYAILGFYLLGKLKIGHETELKKIAVPRLLLAVASLSFAIYLVPGLFGSPLKAVSGMLPPTSTQEYDLRRIIIENSGGGTAISNSICDENPKYAGLEGIEAPLGIQAYFDYEEGMACAKKMNKPVFIDFTGHTCGNCKVMESSVFADGKVMNKLRADFIFIKLYNDDKNEVPEEEWVLTEDGETLKTIGKINVHLQREKFGKVGQPQYYILSPEGDILAGPLGKEQDIEKFLAFLEKGLGKMN